MIRISIRAALFVTLANAALSLPTAAQIQASERAIVGQTIDGTELTIEYSRPQVRGREVFGGIVPWDVVWTPGANWATTFETSNDINLNGVAVPAGKYSVWTIPRPDEWLIMLNAEPQIFHFLKPDSTQAAVHIRATPETAAHTEMLTWSFSAVRGDFATLALHWGTTAVPMRVAVPATRPVIAAEVIAMYVGSYDMTVVPVDPSWPESATLEVFEENGRLRGRMSFTIHPVDDEVFDMVPTGPGRFNPGLYHDGEFFNVEMGVGFDFTDDGERATGFRFVGGEGSVFGQGRRKNE
ncbi:MAG TPA: DUF2911 domain-containing protein [Longimicrobiales bacterium]|nr:DUF2911 domain-containing protein [Longimicrobiales bacterium]